MRLLCCRVCSVSSMFWTCVSRRNDFFLPLTHCGLVTLWGQRPGLTLAQITAWRLMAPSHYLNKCWLIIGEVLCHLPESNSQEILKISVIDLSLKINNVRLQLQLPGVSELKHKKSWTVYMILGMYCITIQATGHHMNQCWKRSPLLYGHNELSKHSFV